MRVKYYYSIYGPLLKKFIGYKKGLGYRYVAEESLAFWFDKAVLDMELDTIGLTKDQVETICTFNPNLSTKTKLIKTSFVRQFSIFLQDSGYKSFLPKIPPHHNTYMPYIFSKKEMDAIFNACDNYQTNFHNGTTYLFTIPTLIRMLYGTGLRIGEALKLTLNDIDLQNNCLTLRGCKNGKDRLIPLSDSLAEVCRHYYEYRMSRQFVKHVDSFFVSHAGYPFSRNHVVYYWFRKILFIAGISHGGKGAGPRLHDLRHTFSVHSLLAMSESGVDLYYSLPVLSTYLGHQTLRSTDKYVRLTAEMYPELVKKINESHPNLFPKTFKNANDETN